LIKNFNLTQLREFYFLWDLKFIYLLENIKEFENGIGCDLEKSQRLSDY